MDILRTPKGFFSGRITSWLKKKKKDNWGTNRGNIGFIGEYRGIWANCGTNPKNQKIRLYGTNPAISKNPPGKLIRGVSLKDPPAHFVLAQKEKKLYRF